MTEYGEANPQHASKSGARSDGQRRPYVGIRFDCCAVYVRVYRRREQMYYEARCPKCLRATRIRVAPNGVSTRFFTAT